MSIEGLATIQQGSSNSPFKQIWNLFLPVLAGSVISSLVGICNIFLAGDLGTNAQAAIGFADQVLFLVVIIGGALATASSYFISRAMGAAQFSEAESYARDSVLVAATLGMAATVAGVALAGPLLDCFQCDAELKALAVPYVQLSSIANAPLVLLMCQSAILRTVGKAGSATMIAMLSTLVTIISSTVLFNLAGTPIGHSMNALAGGSILGAFAGVIYASMQMRRFLPGCYSLNCLADANGTKGRIGNLLSTAAPAVIGEFILIAASFGKYALIAGMADAAAAQAACAISAKVEETLALLPLLALASAVSVVCGRYVGAGRVEEIAGICIRVAFLAVAAMLAVGLFLSLEAQSVAGFFTNDAATLRAAATLLQPSALVMPACAVWFVMSGALDGAGLTKQSGIVSSTEALVGCLSLSLFFVADGVAGLASSAVLSTLIATAVACYFFFRNYKLTFNSAEPADACI